MKIRANYVSNSSSSSYIIAYDQKFFGNLLKFFKDHQNILGYNTKVVDREEMLLYWIDDHRHDEIRRLMREAEENGMTILCLKLDYEQYSICDLLKSINDINGGDKFKIIDRD